MAMVVSSKKRTRSTASRFEDWRNLIDNCPIGMLRQLCEAVSVEPRQLGHAPTASVMRMVLYNINSSRSDVEVALEVFYDKISEHEAEMTRRAAEGRQRRAEEDRQNRIRFAREPKMLETVLRYHRANEGCTKSEVCVDAIEHCMRLRIRCM